MKFLLAITKQDIGKTHIKVALYKQAVDVGSAIGPVQKIDVGKYVYASEGIIQVESSEQRDERQLREKQGKPPKYLDAKGNPIAPTRFADW